ncbi:hypothetical protein JMJ56_03950 [Belnapia sp. T18]|uniref:Uncharacterized protein n=1 Tax=Belnapia arida TaxID=2804533 RepID=A0ABS1TXG2_9PROT|nr:hypothetical protein [Belnapia arida]MBL6077146.1 hypothetical protein [Belnapia arida]
MSAELSIRGQRVPERYSHAFGGSVERLPEGWICGRHCDIGGDPGRPVRVDLVLLHPGLGVALLDFGEKTEGAEQVLRARLEEARFGAIFGGYLPVLHGCLGSDEVPDMAGIARAFDQVPPLSVSGGSAWISTVARLIVPVDRAWADNWVGAANRGAAPRMPTQASHGGNVVPLRRVAAVQPPAAEPEDLAMPVQPPAPRARKPWLMAGGAGVAAVAVLAGLWLGSGHRPEPVARSAATAGVVTPVQSGPAPVAAALPSMPMAPSPAAVTPVAVVAPVMPPPAAQRPLSRPVRMERPARARPPARPAQRAASQRSGRG